MLLPENSIFVKGRDFLVVSFFFSLISGCAELSGFVNSSVYENAIIETQLNRTSWRINFSGREVSMQKAIDFSLLKAGELALNNGYKYFEVDSQSTRMKSYTVTQKPWSVKNKDGTISRFGGGTKRVNEPVVETKITMHNDKELVNNNTYESELIVLSLSASYSIDAVNNPKLNVKKRINRSIDIDQNNKTTTEHKNNESNNSIYAGTGFIFGAQDYIITNWHVIRGMNSIKVHFVNGEIINAQVLLKDTYNDIAFLKLDKQPQLPLSNIRIGDSSKVKMGDEVFTIGYPAHQILGKNPKYSKGEVNALSGISDDSRVFQISVEIQPGNSGGPLFNSKGEVVGITQASLDSGIAISAFGMLPKNINYAIKSDHISDLIQKLPSTMIASRGIVVVPNNPEKNLAGFIDRVQKNIVIIEAHE